MSHSQIKDWSKNELKNRLLKMGISIDKNEHPKSYYENLYLEQMNTKNKITRNNHPFGKEQLLRTKRERNNSKEKKESKDYKEAKEKEENISINDDDEDKDEIENLNENDFDENNQENEDKKIPSLDLRKIKTKEIIELNKNYKQSGIKYTRLIPMKKKKMNEKKTLAINPENNNVIKIITFPKNHSADENEALLSNELIENEIIKESPLKQSKKNSQKNIKENNGFIPDNNNIEKTPESKVGDNNNDISLKVKSSNVEEKSPEPEQKQILFGAPKTYDKNSNIFLSQGPISFGFNQSTNSKNLGNTESNKDTNTNKKYNAFVKNISEAVKDNIKDSQNSGEKRAKTILLKWESPRQKEFLSNSMDIENNLENTDNKINVSYNFNERLNNLDNEDIQLGKGLKNKKDNFLSYNNNYVNESKKDNFKKGKNIPKDINEYKNKLRSYDKDKNQLYNDIEEDNENGNDGSNIKNPFYEKDNKEIQIEGDYIESHDIYGSLNQKENKNYNTKNNYYDNNNNNNLIFEDEYVPKKEQKDYNNDTYLKHIKEQNDQLFNNINERNDFHQKKLEDKIKYFNKDENFNLNEENEKDIYENDLEINDYLEEQEEQNKKGRFSSKIAGIKNSIMNKFKNKVYLWPLILLILFGIVYFLNNTYERFENTHIIIVFSILMGLLVLYNLIRYLITKRNYKKMAKADRKALLDLLKENNITHEELANNMMLVSNFINTRIEEHKIDEAEYMKYVFKYLKKYLKKDGFDLNIDENNDENKHDYWKEI
jgi:hypothetical protein